jgi:hypothetical protein
MIAVTTSGANRVITITYTFPSQKVLDTLEEAAHNLFFKTGRGLTEEEYTKLTSAQKLDLVDRFVRSSVTELAKENHINVSYTANNTTATAETVTKFI